MELNNAHSRGNGLNELVDVHLPQSLYIEVDMHGQTTLHMTLSQLRQLYYIINDYLTDYSSQSAE